MHAHLHRLSPGPIDLVGLGDELSELQDRLRAARTTGSSDATWYRNLVIGQLLWPAPDFDVEEQRRRLQDESPAT
jgi:hypothetical protein